MGRKIDSIINRKALALSLVWAVLVVTIVICHALYNLVGIDSRDGKVYYSIQHEGNPLEVGLDEFQETYDDLSEAFSQEGYRYLEIYYQYLESAKEDRGEFYTAEDVLDQSAGTIEAAQISINVLDDADISGGRYFEKEDYAYCVGDAIPVLMGAAYKGIYDLGDTFQAVYLYQEYTFQIVGFLREGTQILGGEGFAIADHYVVMPSFHLYGSDGENGGYLIHYANKISGLVQASQYDDSDIEKINAILAEHGVGKCTVRVFPYKYQKIHGLSILTLSRGMLVVLAAEVIAYLCILIHCRKKPMQQRQGIYWSIILLLSVFWIYVFDVLSGKTMGIAMLSVKSILLLIFIAFSSYLCVFRKTTS